MHKPALARATAICALVSVTFACATVSNGPMQRIRVDSDPRVAAVRLDRCCSMATHEAVTPATVWVSRRSTQCRIVVSLPGEDEQSIRLDRHLSRHLIGYPDAVADYCGPDVKNCNSIDDLFVMTFFSMVVLVPGLAVDFATGSMFELNPSRITTEFRHPVEPIDRRD